MLDFSDYAEVLESEEEEFEEMPVPLEEFLYSKKYMHLPQLSDIQLEIVKRGSQIYKEHTLIRLYGEEGRRMWKNKCKEFVFCLGKGSGKDFLSVVICSYIVYQLLCLKDPSQYFGSPTGESIDIVNVAINAQQATRVFFKSFKTRIENCPWFRGKFNPRASDVEFDKGVTVHSKNSENEATEGLNIIVAVLDEIDGFEIEAAKTMYNTLNGTVSSRFNEVGKVLLLSFPRTDEGFLLTHYNNVVKEKEVIKRTHTFKLDEDLPDGIKENEFTIHWDEDHVVGYKYPGVMAIRRPTWDVHPNKTIDIFKMDFYREPEIAQGKFACTPTGGDGRLWYKDKEQIDYCFSKENGLSDVEGNDVDIILVPDKDKQYYIHVDLARVQDNCAIAMSHVDCFKKAAYYSDGETSPFVIVDMVRYWKPDRSRPVDFSDVRNFIIALKRKGFNIAKVTFDRWNSDLIMKDLEAVGIEVEKLSVSQHHYSELALLMGQGMILGPNVELLRRELKKLIVDDQGRVDHKNKESKDLSDAVCGSVFNALSLTPRGSGASEVKTIDDLLRERRKVNENRNVIGKPGRMPEDIKNFLGEIRLL